MLAMCGGEKNRDSEVEGNKDLNERALGGRFGVPRLRRAGRGWRFGVWGYLEVRLIDSPLLPRDVGNGRAVIGWIGGLGARISRRGCPAANSCGELMHLLVLWTVLPLPWSIGK